ncbi:hypothetical protein B0H13DRAFT_1852389 [Mycena leptocephala]|nr:hypothetical protein B0H13DRAFT_1852389 [Mycena leptocephala]
MDKRHWDLTPSDTNPIEGSHAQDNQVNSTNRSLLEGILLAKKLGGDTARVIMATLKSVVLENPNNSLRARFRNMARREARSKEKQNELQSLTGKEAKKLRWKVKTATEGKRLGNHEAPTSTSSIDPASTGSGSVKTFKNRSQCVPKWIVTQSHVRLEALGGHGANLLKLDGCGDGNDMKE